MAKTKRFSFSPVISAVFTLLAAAPLLFAFVAASDFSGEWAYNAEESDLGNTQFNFVWDTLLITQTEEDITIERRGEGQNGPVEMTDVITLDGEPSENTGLGNSVKQSTAEWSSDGNILVIESEVEFTAQGQTNQVTSTETFSLDDSGNVLSIQNEVSSNFGEITQELIYEKQ